MSQIVAPLSPSPAALRPSTGAARSASFWIVAAVLLVAALGLKVAVDRMQITFRKLPVDPSFPLKTIKSEVGPWVQVSVDRAMNPEFEQALGANEYVFRDYIDTRLLSAADRRAFLAAAPEGREKLRQKLSNLDPHGVVRFALTYYTGSVDTVPHVPERCYAADGYNPTTHEKVIWPILPRDNAADKNTAVRLINFVDQIDSRNSRPRQVSYFFQVNGAYEEDPVGGVRVRLQNLFDRKAYFAKIELVTDLPEPSAAGPVMSDFLTFMMPEVERVLPDWKKVNK